MAIVKVEAPEGSDVAGALGLLENPEYLSRALSFAKSYRRGRMLIEVEAFLCNVRDRCTLTVRRGVGRVEVRLEGSKCNAVIRYDEGGDGIVVSVDYTGPYSWRISRAILSAAADAAWSALRETRRRASRSRSRTGVGTPGGYRRLLEGMRLVDTLEARVEKGGLPGLLEEAARSLGGLVMAQGVWERGELACLLRDGRVVDALVVRGEERILGPDSLLLVEGDVSLRIYAERR